MFRRIVLVLVTVVTVAPALVLGQSGTSTVAGIVRDSLGGAIPGVTIHIVDATTSDAQDLFTDENGFYRAEGLTPGAYRIEVTLDGFEPVTRTVTLDLGQIAASDFTLTPARLTEAVTVTARRMEEAVQEVPIPVSVVTGASMADAGAFNVNRLKEMIPTVQFTRPIPATRRSPCAAWARHSV
jgi:iron complex outermembrane receptor protein